MPGRGSYGKGGKWIHDRAHHIMSKSPDIDKGVAYAVATQQAHKVGKSPKGFRTSEGVATAKSKYPFPKNVYKKTASDRAIKLAYIRLKKLQKEAELKTKPKPGTKNTYTAEKVRGVMTPRKQGKRERLVVPHGSVAERTGFADRALRGQNTPQYKAVSRRTKAGRVAKANMIGNIIADKISNLGSKSAPRAVESLAKAPKKVLNPRIAKVLRYGGLGALGVGAGVAGHQLAHSVGLTETGPADTLADIVVPDSKYSHDKRFVGMYIPRYFLEKAAASMAGALEDNEGSMFETGQQMLGPESSVIPQQTLDTSVPILQHANRVEKENEDLLSGMFSNYKSVRGERIGSYPIGETEVPMSKQAGRLAIG